MTSAVLRAVYPNIAKYVDGISKEKSVKAACEVMDAEPVSLPTGRQ